MTITTNLIPVGVKVEPSDFNPAKYVVVTTIWEGVDRPTTSSMVVPKSVARRLEKAILAGAVHYNTHIATDINGKTYVANTSRVMGNYVNADLKKLGY